MNSIAKINPDGSEFDLGLFLETNQINFRRIGHAIIYETTPSLDSMLWYLSRGKVVFEEVTEFDLNFFKHEVSETKPV